MALIDGLDLSDVLSSNGYLALGLIIALESAGLPLPGETALISAGLIAGTSGKLDVGMVIAAASVGAVMGDNLGFLLGRILGPRILLKYGRYLRLTDERIKIGKYLFMRYGAALVFIGRFVAVLRAAAAFLAGSSGMRWRVFLIFNAAGGLVWASLYGFGAYYLGQKAAQIAGPATAVAGVLAICALAAVAFLIRRHEKDLSARAERAFPGPLRPT